MQKTYFEDYNYDGIVDVLKLLLLVYYELFKLLKSSILISLFLIKVYY
jgi:hypothetical protein